MGKTAIILGATGLTGSALLSFLLNDDAYTCVKLFSRKSVGFSHPKLQEYIGDIIHLERLKNDFSADEVFCCIGTTKAKTKNKDTYRAIDFGIPVKAARLAKENGINFFAVISALGANKNSRFFYNKTKGEMEQEVLAQAIEHTYIVRPSLIKGDRKEKRFGEDLGNSIFKLLRPILVGSLKKYRAINAKEIARTLYKLPILKPSNNCILSDEITIIANKK